MVKSGKIPGSRRKLCGRSPGSFKDHKGLGLLFGLLSSRGCSLIWKESDEVIYKNGSHQTCRIGMTWDLERSNRSAFFRSSYGAYGKITISLFFKVRLRAVMTLLRFLGSCSMFEAELWGILDGLSILVDRGYDNILVQTDSLEVANAIKEGFTRGSNFALIRRIIQLFAISLEKRTKKLIDWSSWFIWIVNDYKFLKSPHLRDCIL
ncbi:hypothetical protein Gotri_004218 [Gossypium trilobum]|uniref:RNase H type-1 domain-containing protein n=1 Tax=Gossypium trilobum TaxID=34281 RepID=A0A7J9F443_9ROSI|nr:hypothetical protein [Gossypium trilobum]